MGLRVTVCAAVVTGLFAAPCGGVVQNLIHEVGDGAKELAREEVRQELGTPEERQRRALEAERVEREVCPKLEVEPTVEEEYALGGALAIHWAERGGGLLLEPDDERTRKLHVYLNTVGKNLGAQSPRPTLEWTFGVLKDTGNFNAVSAPGGYVFVTQRLLAGVDNEGQLAGVLAHEIAHIVLKHAIHQYNDAKVTVCKTAAKTSILSPRLGKALMSAVEDSGGNVDLDKDPELLGTLAEKTVELFDRGNSRKQELEADALAVRLMLSAGYDPKEYARLIEKTAEGGGVFANHPSKKDRLAHIEDTVTALTKARKGEFQELTTEGLRTPPLKPELTAVIRPNVAKDGR